jgi:hypothetical protein
MIGTRGACMATRGQEEGGGGLLPARGAGGPGSDLYGCPLYFVTPADFYAFYGIFASSKVR